MTYALTWLPEVLQRAGLIVSETLDWRTRGRAEMGTIKGVICHHTGTARGGNMPTLGMLIKGRPDLTGPLCHLGLGRDGTFYIVAAGRANHAGPGAWETIRTGNSNFIGIEAENSGAPDDPWPEAQLDAYRRGVAAILRQIGAGANMVCGHKEYALPSGRKVDPTFDMPSFRSEVSQLLSGKSPPPPIPASDANRRPTLRKGRYAAASDVKTMQAVLGLRADGTFDSDTEAAVRAWQRARGLTPDGIFGPRSWDMLDAEPAPLPDPIVQPALASIAPTTTAIAANGPTGLVKEIDAKLMAIAFPYNTAAQLALWIEPLQIACTHYGITLQKSLCGFLANIDVESHSLVRPGENLNYSVAALLSTFGIDRISRADAERLGRQPTEHGSISVDRQRQIADIVYGGTYGADSLGNTQEGDGWTFRGCGPIQITGRRNLGEFGDTVGMNVADVPTFVNSKPGGCLAAAWYWHSNCPRDIDNASVVSLREAVNRKGLGMDQFTTRFDQIKAELDRRQTSP